jgi:hypothetical protein
VATEIQLGRAMVTVDRLTDASSQVGGGAQHVVKAHVPRNGAIVEKHVDIAARIGATVGLGQKAGR